MGGILHQPPGQKMAGHSVGILLLDNWYPTIPGNVANASTYPFPVRYKVVYGVDSPRLIAGDPTLLEPILAAARELVTDGCRAIIGACGYFARFQKELADALPVPVFMSSLSQVPMLLGSLSTSEHLGIICARKTSLDDSMLAAVGVAADAPLIIAGLEDKPAFRAAILEDQGWMDTDAVRGEVVTAARDLVREHPSVRAILLECSDLPPYAHLIQQDTGLPVWDFITLANWIHLGVLRTPYDGFI